MLFLCVARPAALESLCRSADTLAIGRLPRGGDRCRAATLARGNPEMASDMLDILLPALALGCFGVAILYARAAAGL
jgi:hypothetical protein